MLAVDRMRFIAERVQTQSSVRVIELARSFGVSGETIRRDLEVLEREGLVRRVYGGAVDSRQHPVRLYRERELHRMQEKRGIGKLAATLVQDGDALILDVGTTVRTLCNYLQDKKDLTVITPSLQAAQLMKAAGGSRIILTGGELQSDEPYLTGPCAEATLREYYAQRAFVSVGGISLDTGLTDFIDAEVQVRKTILQRAGQIVVLADSSKIGVRALSVICGLDAMDILVTDSHIHPDVRSQLEDMGVEVMLAEPE